MAKGKEYHPKHCAKCGAEIKDREIGFKYGVVNIQRKSKEKEQRFAYRYGRMAEQEVTRTKNMRPQVMLCMECADDFVDVINDFVGEVHDDVA